MGVPMKIILSRKSREKMSYARSPRLVCSTTIGTSAISVSFLNEILFYVLECAIRPACCRDSLMLCRCACGYGCGPQRHLPPVFAAQLPVSGPSGGPWSGFPDPVLHRLR